MNALMKRSNAIEKLFRNSGDTFFGRTIDDILANGFFNSFDTNIQDEQNLYVLQIAVPGMTRKDISIHVDGAVLLVSAQRQEKNSAWNSMEFNSQHFHRSFSLPDDADTNNIKATCRNGLLTIHIGKIKARGAHRIIKIAGGEPDATMAEKITSWWSRLADKTHRLFAGKR